MAKSNTYRHKTDMRPVARFVGKILAVCGWALCIVFLLLGISLTLVAGYRWATTTEIVAVHEVQVQGVQRLSRQEVVSQAGLHRFHNLLDISLWKIRRDVLDNPWIKSVTVVRSFPHTLRIHVEEEVPFFWRQKGERVYYADEHGEYVAPVRVASFTSLPLLVCDPNKRRDQRDLAIMTGKIVQSRFPFSMAEIAWIRLQDNNRLEIGLLDGDIQVVLGREQLEANVHGLIFIWQDLQRRKELEQIARILVVQGTGWVGYRSKIV